MSSSTYTLKIAIDDSKIRDIEKRLMGIVGGQGISGGAGVKSAGGGGGAIAKNIGKIGMIATGVIAIVGLVTKMSGMIVDASPVLQSMLKLLNTGIMFMLRPIGDFFGFFLRPIIILFLRTIALPFYREFAPIMRKFGTWLGNAVADFLTDPLGALDKILQSGALGVIGLAVGYREEIFEGVEKIIEGVTSAITSITEWINGFELPDFITPIKEWIDTFVFPNFIQPVLEWIDTFVFPDFITPIREWIEGFAFPNMAEFYDQKILPLLTGISGVFLSILTYLVDSVSSIWADITTFFTELSEKLTDLPGVIWEAIVGAFTGGGGSNNNNNTNSNNTVNIFDMDGNGKSDIEETLDGVGKRLNDMWSSAFG